MKKIWVLLALFGLLQAGPALAVPTQVGSWRRACGPSPTTGLNGGEYACYTPAAGADLESASPALSVVNCENVDVALHDDFDGDATACTVTWDIEMCPPNVGSLTTDALRNAACNTLPGTVALSGDDVEANLASFFLRVHGLAAGLAIDSCRIVVKCAEGAQ